MNIADPIEFTKINTMLYLENFHNIFIFTDSCEPTV
jgi:hypothetical protein